MDAERYPVNGWDSTGSEATTAPLTVRLSVEIGKTTGNTRRRHRDHHFYTGTVCCNTEIQITLAFDTLLTEILKCTQTNLSRELWCPFFAPCFSFSCSVILRPGCSLFIFSATLVSTLPSSCRAFVSLISWFDLVCVAVTAGNFCSPNAPELSHGH